MTHGSILVWKMEEGEAVTEGDIIADVETDTAIMELEAHGSGFLRHILIQEGHSVKTDTMLAIIGDLDDDTESIVQEALKIQDKTGVFQTPSKSTGRPTSRHRPQTEELTTIPHAHAASDSESAVPSHALNERKQESSTTRSSALNDDDIPRFHLTTDVSMAEGERLREQMIDIQHMPLSLTTLYVRAAALAFSRLPTCLEIFSSRGHSLDIGIGIIVDDRVLTPTLHDCGRKNIAELSREIQVMTKQTRVDPRFCEKESGARFSILHLGMYPIERCVPILTPPQTAALSIGAIRDVRLEKDGTVTVDRRATVTLTCQQPGFDEKQGSQLLDTLKQLLERPLAIFLPNPVE